MMLLSQLNSDSKEIILFTFQLNAAEIDADAAVAFATEFAVVDAGDQGLSGCLCVGYSLSYLDVMTSPQVGFLLCCDEKMKLNSLVI